MGTLYSDKNELWIEERIKEFIESHPTLEIDEKRIRHFLFSYLLLNVKKILDKILDKMIL